MAMLGTALIVFPKLALGLSGFETGVVVMPLVQSNGGGSLPQSGLQTTHGRTPWASPELHGRIKNTKKQSAAVPNAIAAFLLFLRDETGKLPHVYFGWSEGNPLSYLLKYIAFGEGDTAPVTHEVLRQAEKDPDQRPIVHVGG